MSKAFDRLVGIMDRLRDPGGCPWDREQTLESLASFLLEEAYEVVDAVSAGDGGKLCEELGDLLAQIVFMARLGREQGSFDMDRVCDAISEKMVRRHPHVFASTEVRDPQDAVRSWEDIKRQERVEKREESALDGIPAALPGLLKAFRMTEKAAALGFDWERPADVVDKLHEEVAELEAEVRAGTEQSLDRIRDELGDVLFVMANLARHLNVEPEAALQAANQKFLRRFQAVEARVSSGERQMNQMRLEELDQIWDEVKTGEG